jgi:hypothetical protein
MMGKCHFVLSLQIIMGNFDIGSVEDALCYAVSCTAYEVYLCCKTEVFYFKLI